jgi:ABC-type nitrate/sulfonate/bicarbonate transport system substrate-binding protein
MIYRKAQATRLAFTMLSFFLLLGGFAAVHAAASPTKVVLTVGAISEREGILYVALDQGFFRKHGVDLTVVQVRSGPIGIAALSSGESQLNWGSVSAANLGAVAEGADLVFVVGFINKLAGNVVSNPRIKSPPELKGKSIGINSLGGGAWILTMPTLDYWALYRSGIGFSSGHWVPSR